MSGQMYQTDGILSLQLVIKLGNAFHEQKSEITSHICFTQKNISYGYLGGKILGCKIDQINED